MTVLVLIFLLLVPAATPRPAVRSWRPAIFKGLTVGKSKKADMLRVLGKPKWSRLTPKIEDEPDEGGVIWNNYERAGEFPGITNIGYDSKTERIIRIDFFPEKLTKEEAIAHYGRGSVITRYAVDSCLAKEADEDFEPLYETPDGPITIIEYRSRGIALSLGFNGMVTKIGYVSGPIGHAKSECPPRNHAEESVGASCLKSKNP